MCVNRVCKPLSFATLSSSPFRGAKAAAPQREASSRPYPVRWKPGAARVANLATRWHEVPLPPLEGEVPNEREAEGFVRQQSV